MRFLTIARPGAMPPPAELVRAAQEWIHGKIDDGTFECVYSFPEGGGFSVCNVDSLEDQMDLMGQYPMAPFVTWEIHPLGDVDDGFERALAMLDRIPAQAG